MVTRVRLMMILGMLCLPAPPAVAQQDDSGWTFKAAPYLMFPSLKGDITIRGQDFEADIGPEDIFSNLNIGFMGYFEAKKDDRWGVALDIVYSSVDASDDSRLAEIDATQGFYTGMLSYRVGKAVELYGGARYNDIGANVNFQGPLGRQTVSRDKSWVDPLVGVRIATPISERWNFALAADVGGFGIGSDIAINVWPVFTYEFSPGISGAIGYRLLYTDYDSGSGADRFAYDITMAGPTVGVVFNF